MADAEGDVLQNGLDAVGFVNVVCGKHNVVPVRSRGDLSEVVVRSDGHGRVAATCN